MVPARRVLDEDHVPLRPPLGEGGVDGEGEEGEAEAHEDGD